MTEDDIATAFANLDEARVEVIRAHAEITSLRATIIRVQALCDAYDTDVLAGMNVAYQSVVTDLRAALGDPDSADRA
jgi:hypothetical protein